MNINILHGKGDFVGGMCSINDEAFLVLNKLKPIDQRLNVLARSTFLSITQAWPFEDSLIRWNTKTGIGRSESTSMASSMAYKHLSRE